MEILNRTPFVPLIFENQDVDGDDFHVFVLKGTFDILDGQPLRPSQVQMPLVLADDYFGEDPLRSSVRVESDVVPLKMNGEVTLEANAYSPNGMAHTDWEVEVIVGSHIHHRLRVFGPRYWKYGPIRGWHLTNPEPILEVPVRYELAYGGTGFDKFDNELIYEGNPCGVGFMDFDNLDLSLHYPAPQIEFSDQPIIDIKSEYEPAGFGPIAKHWMSRRELCGTADDAWKSERWPMLPIDFDPDYFNGAPEPLVIKGFFDGDENFKLNGLTRSGNLSFSLPGYDVDLVVDDIDDYRITVEMNLDTVHIDVDGRKAFLVWRGTFLKMDPLKQIVSTVSGKGVVHHA